MRPRRAAIVAAMLAVGPAIGSGATSEPAANYRYDCGVNSLLLLGELEGRRLEPADLFAALPPRPPAGYSMAELIAAADRLGFPLEGVRLSGETLTTPEPMLFFLEAKPDGHFAVLRPVGVTGTMVQVIDPPDPPRVLDYARLRALPGWTGRALVRRHSWWARFRIPLALAGLSLALFIEIKARKRSSAAATMAPGIDPEAEPAREFEKSRSDV